MNQQDTIEISRRIVDGALGGASRHELLGDFCEHLIDAGVPLFRSFIAQRTLDPLIGGHGFEWQRGKGGTTQRDFARGGKEITDDMWLKSPFHHMLSTDERTLRHRLEGSNEPLAFPVLDDLKEMGGTDYFAVATSFGEADQLGPMNGILSSWSSDRAGGFSDDDIATIDLLLPILGLAFKSIAVSRIANSIVETYLGKDAGHRVLSGEIQRGSVETISAVLWYCDMQGFTKIAETTPGDQLITMLNEYFEIMVDTVHAHGGQVLKFMGDGLLAIFKLEDGVDVCATALDAAEKALLGIAELSATRGEAGLPVSKFVLALHLGDVMYGNIGGRDRLDFTVVGPAVNEVGRIEAMCRSLDQDVITSSAFAEGASHCASRLVSLGRYALRGVGKPQELFTLDTEGEDRGAGDGA